MISNINNKKGFYTVEASIILPIVILAALSIGYFMKMDSLWENCMYGALDESSRTAAEAPGKVTVLTGKARINNRLVRDNPELDSASVQRYITGYSDKYSDNITSFTFKVSSGLSLPLGFGRDFNSEGKVKYRGFSGKKDPEDGMGAEALETDELSDPVYIFPKSGVKYHTSDCTYVKAAVSACVLTGSIKNKYKSCEICDSGSMPAGSIVFCFTGENTAYHRNSCRSIKRHPAVINRSEAIEKGYTSCSKCGGGE